MEQLTAPIAASTASHLSGPCLKRRQPGSAKNLQPTSFFKSVSSQLGQLIAMPGEPEYADRMASAAEKEAEARTAACLLGCHIEDVFAGGCLAMVTLFGENGVFPLRPGFWVAYWACLRVGDAVLVNGEWCAHGGCQAGPIFLAP